MAIHVAACGELDQLTWTARLSKHYTQRLTVTVHGGDKYIDCTHLPAPCNMERKFFLGIRIRGGVSLKPDRTDDHTA